MEFENIKELQPYIESAEYLYKTNAGYKLRSDYYDSYINCEVKDKTIMYEAFFGRGITCNPGELFRYLLNDPRFADYEHIWSLENSIHRESIIAQYADYSNVRFVEPKSKEYFDALSSSKYLINNVAWQYYFSKKPEQVVINTWHGIPLKFLGYDVPNGNVDVANVARNFYMSDFLISPVKFTTEIYKNAYKLNGLYNGNVIETGYPRVDATVKRDKAALKKELEAYGVPYDENKKLILYAPTWKGEKYASPDVAIDEYDEFLRIVSEQIDTDEYQVLFKPHQIVYKTMLDKGIVRENFVPAVVNTNVLLGVADVLVSDYSSIFFDFLATGRPIYFYINDVDVYKQMRGLYFNIEDLPGPVAQSVEQLALWLKDTSTYSTLFNYENYEKAVKKFVTFEDGNVCQRVVDAIFFDDRTNCLRLETEKKKILIHTDKILTNGISFSAYNLISKINTDKYDVTFYSAGDRNVAIEYLEKFPKDVRVLFRSGANPLNVITDARRQYCLENGIVQVDNDPMFPTEFYRMEHARNFGDIKFDCIINFSGFSAYFANIYFSSKYCPQLTWMHSVMQSEYNNRVSNGKFVFQNMLNCVYKLYPYLDKCVSCSRTTMIENRKALATDETYDKFGYAKNLMDADRVLNGKDNKCVITLNGKRYFYIVTNENEERLIPCPNDSGLNFAAVGRLSGEKNYEGLIKAFAKFVEDNPEARLYILGDGPLRNDLRKLINSLDMRDNVVLTGNVANPFAIIGECDCFVLPSFYEGQPMVLLEARALGLPIIVSDFATVKDSIFENGQLIIGMEIDDIYNALVKFKNGEVPNEFVFDYNKYNEEAIAEFEKNVDECLNNYEK